MSKTFLAMDMKLFDKKIADKFKMSIASFNKEIVEKINSQVKNEDTIIIGGIFTKGNFLQTLNLVNNINGKKVLINRNQYNTFST